MRVGYIVKEFPKLTETFIVREILELERRGFQVTVFSLRCPELLVPHGWLAELKARIIYLEATDTLPKVWDGLRAQTAETPGRRDAIRAAVAEAFDYPNRKGRSYLAAAAAISSLAAEAGIEHLHAHFANRPAFVAMLAHLISGVPYSFTAHAKDIYTTGPDPDLWRAQVGRAAFAVTVSDANLDHIARLVGNVFAGKVRRLYNGVDLDRIKPLVRGNTAPLRLLFAGRLVEKKGADLVIEAASHLRDRGFDFRCTLIGQGELEESLRGLAARRGLDGIVDFVPAVAHEELVERTRGSDVFILPCRVGSDDNRDALPTVLLEAMAAGVPCVSTPVNGVPEIIRHGRTGLLVPEDDPIELSQAIARLLQSASLRRRMSLLARRRAELLFDSAKNVAVLAGWFLDVASRESVEAGTEAAQTEEVWT